jgi:hypothetical protein
MNREHAIENGINQSFEHHQEKWNKRRIGAKSIEIARGKRQKLQDAREDNSIGL